jgi:hypothetical protein
LIGFPAIRGRFKDKGVRRCGVLSHYLSISRNRCFKNIGIDTLAPQKAICAWLSFEGADNAAKGMAESAAKSGTIIRGKKDGCFASDNKGKSGKVEIFQLSTPLTNCFFSFL